MTNLYHNCDIPLERYIRLVVDKDLEALVIDADAEPVPTLEELRAAEIAISSEFGELTGNQNAATLHENVSRLCELESKVTVVRYLVAAANLAPLPRLIAALKEFDFGVDLDITNPDALAADLDRILIEIKVDEVEILQLDAALSKSSEENDAKTDSVTRSYFDDMLLAFESFMHGQQYDTSITLRKYAALLRRYEAYVKSAMKRHGRRK